VVSAATSITATTSSARPLRWPLRPLLEACDLTVTGLARELGVGGNTVAVAGRRGLTDVQADRWAVHFGLHPVLVWGWEWIEAAGAASLTGPAHRPLAEDLRRRIERGRLRPGDVVPTAKALADHWGVSEATAARATAELRRAGLLVGGRGRPNRVARPPVGGGARRPSATTRSERICCECDETIVPGEEHFPHLPDCTAAEVGECDCDLPTHAHCCWTCRMEAAG
jgi:DNA-binding transcriptional regulator YhcF (GntR family)